MSAGEPVAALAAPASPPPLPAREERLHALDNLRAVAMLLGIVLHAAISFMELEFPWVARDVSRSWAFDVMVGVIHGFRMQLFFFIAGFFAHLLWQRLGPGQFIGQRMQRVAVPFAVGMVTLIPLMVMIWIWAATKGQGKIEPPVEQASGLAALPTAHLWFLEYLLFLYAGALFLAWAAGRWLPDSWRSRADAAFDCCFASPWKPLLLIPFTMLCLWNGPVWGEVELVGLSVVPKLRSLIYYGLYFGVGWWLHRRREQLPQLGLWLKRSFALAGLAILTHGALYGMQGKTSHPNYLALKAASLFCVAAYSWLMVFAGTGWFLRFVGQHRGWVRYLADASYWFYLAHLPIVLWLHVLVAKWPWHCFLKFAFVNAVTGGLLLATYHYGVRYSILGRILNGPRERPVKA